MFSLLQDRDAQLCDPMEFGGEAQPSFVILDATTHPLPMELHDYWESKRHGERLPSRGDIDPSDIRAHLPYLMICDVLRDPLNLRYRLWGTELAYWLGGDPTGLCADQLGMPPADLEGLYRVLARMVETRQPVLYGGEHRLHSGRRYPFESVALPLASDGENIDMLVSGLGLYLP